MHSRSMNDSEGTFDRWQHAIVEGEDGHSSPWPCRVCGGVEVFFRHWESDCGGHDDIQYHCRTCDRKWWVDGPDA
jgi:hypothetical protein